jgi:hypothetical protein
MFDIFDILVSGFQAYNQIGMFIGALVCLGIGGLLLGNSLYWRVHAHRASGTIIGVLGKNGMYTPVYRYTLPDGQTHEAKSDISTGWLRGYRSGRVVPLMISSHNPAEARPTNSFLMEIVGLVLIVPGLLLGYFAITAFPVTPMTWIMAGAMLLYLAERGYSIIIPKSQRLSIEEWRKTRGLDEKNSINLSDVKPIEELISTPSYRQERQNQLKNYKFAKPLLSILSAGLLCIGVYEGFRVARLEATGFRADGEVVRLNEQYSSGSHGGSYSYYPVVRYKTEKNTTIEFKDSVGSNPPSYRRGDKVTVLYLENDPKGEAIIDRGLFWNWAIPGILLLAAGFVAWAAIAMLRDTGTKEQEFVRRRAA